MHSKTSQNFCDEECWSPAYQPNQCLFLYPTVDKGKGTPAALKPPVTLCQPFYNALPMRSYASITVPRITEQISNAFSYDKSNSSVRIAGAGRYAFDEIWPPVSLPGIMIKHSPSFLSRLITQLNNNQDSAIVFVNNYAPHSLDFLITVLRALDAHIPTKCLGYECKSHPDFNSTDLSPSSLGWFKVYAALMGSIKLHYTKEASPIFDATVDLLDCKLKIVIVSFQLSDSQANPEKSWQSLDLPCEVMKLVDAMEVAVVVDCAADKQYAASIVSSLNFWNRLFLIYKKLKQNE